MDSAKEQAIFVLLNNGTTMRFDECDDGVYHMVVKTNTTTSIYFFFNQRQIINRFLP